MKQNSLAKNLGITAIHLNAILAGRRNPSAKLAVRLEAATGISRDVWLWGSRDERQEAWGDLRKGNPAARGREAEEGREAGHFQGGLCTSTSATRWKTEFLSVFALRLRLLLLQAATKQIYRVLKFEI